MVDRFVSTSGGRPTVHWTALATTGVGSLLLAWLLGVLELIGSVGAGLASAMSSLSAWLTALIGLTFDIPATAIETAWTANIAFVSGFGVFAPLVVMIEVVVILLIVDWGSSSFVRIISGVIS